MKKIGVIGAIGHVGIGGTTLLTPEMIRKDEYIVIEDPVGRRIRELEGNQKLLEELNRMRSDGSKCRKGHSYRVDLDRTKTKETEQGILLTRKWTCIKCGKHLETNR